MSEAADVVTHGWVPTEKGRHLAGRRSRDTGPELLLRRAVHALGLRYRLQRRLAPGCRPDLLLVGRRLAVFVDGCFWHGCPSHGRRTPFTGPNAGLWEEKMRRNAERDARAGSLAVAAGYRVLRVWECEVRADPAVAAARVAATADERPSGEALLASRRQQTTHRDRSRSTCSHH